MGTVKFYDSAKGLGVIERDRGGKDVLINSVVLERAGMSDPAQAQKVAFETTRNERAGKIAANDIETI